MSSVLTHSLQLLYYLNKFHKYQVPNALAKNRNALSYTASVLLMEECAEETVPAQDVAIPRKV